MAENDDDSSKTEEPTPRRLQQARERGQVITSQDIQIWAALVASTMVLAFLAPWGAQRLALSLQRFFEHPDRIRIDLSTARIGLAAVIADAGMVILPIVLLMAATGVACGLAKAGLIWATSSIEPDFGKISPLKGIGRLFSMKALIEFAKGLVKISIVAAVLGMLVSPLLAGLDSWTTLSSGTLLSRSTHLLVKMTATVAAIMTFVAIADYFWQRFSFLKQMRMTLQEVREEHKQSEGDPHIKSRIRSLRKQRSRQRMMAAVPTATVVVTNPTHYAVALAYESKAMAAPKVVAKGTDAVALRIRELAREHDVPIFENPPLARALHGAVEIDDEILPEHYQAVAQVIGFVMRTKGAHARR